MNLQDILMKLQAYHVGCRVEDGNFLITLIYDEGWKIIPPENNKIDFGQEKDITYYAAAINEVSFDEVFMSIKETIDYNIDLQRKVTLYKANVTETEVVPKIDNGDDDEYLDGDGIGYQEYTGEDVPNDEENKVDYLEQLKNQ